MRKLSLKNISWIFISAASLVACSGNKEQISDENKIVETQDTVKAGVLNIGGQLFSIPSPIQTAILIQKLGLPFNKSILFDSKKVNTFNTDVSRALLLGVYGADLGYVSMYSQTQEALTYLGAIKQLADKLGVSSAFDEKTFKRFENNLTNKDSLMVLVGEAYRASDNYLKNNKRLDISSLILLGGWLESMNIAIESYKSKNNEEIKRRIAEQKLTVNNLNQLITQNAPEQTDILADLKELQMLYDKVQFKYQYVDPTTDTTKKITYINSTNELILNDEDLKNIIEKIQALRNKITSSAS
ncbi:MAG: hypothetical protein KatS3mg027_0867 [Bacteroidia bacterium]|nr:MAG: hypothetical protein KatS3mg027_0867 [Bacteroidia bacterium]